MAQTQLRGLNKKNVLGYVLPIDTVSCNIVATATVSEPNALKVELHVRNPPKATDMRL